MIIEGFKPFVGLHCETTATGSLLNQLGFDFSEPMLFGLARGLGFAYLNMKMMDHPFIGGRLKPDLLTENLAELLPIELDVKETSSLKKAWENVRVALDDGVPVGLKLDCYHLEYFENPIHFAGHYVAMYGYDEEKAFLVDTAPQGSLMTTSLESLARARNEKGPMSSRNRSYTIRRVDRPFDLASALRQAMRLNAEDFLNPPIRNFGYKGIRKFATELPKWFARTKDVERDFTTTAMLMERAGTGGSIFRNIYRDFLAEANGTLASDVVTAAHERFAESAERWHAVAACLDAVGSTGEEAPIHTAADHLLVIAKLEEEGMRLLLAV